MSIKVLEQLEQYVLAQPVTTLVLCKVVIIDKREGYAVCYNRAGKLDFTTAVYFMSEFLARTYFERRCKAAGTDLCQSETIISGVPLHPARTFNEVLRYVNS